MRYSTGQWLAAVLAATALSACRSATRATASTSQAPEPVRVLGDSAAIAAAKPDSNRFPHTEADVHFMSGMIGHHAQAIAMSKLAPTNGASSSIQVLAARIINAQQDEIALMQQWLRDRGQPVPEVTPMGVKMKMHGTEHDMTMPGMLTDEQMKQLEAAKGKEFDELFLRFMIQHHQGAVAMVKQLFSTPGAGQDEATFKLASDVNVDQETEIVRMQKMLFALKTGVPAP